MKRSKMNEGSVNNGKQKCSIAILSKTRLCNSGTSKGIDKGYL
jgi:hypothetical protein